MVIHFCIGLLIFFFNILNISPPKNIAQFSNSGDQLVEQLSASLQGSTVFILFAVSLRFPTKPEEVRSHPMSNAFLTVKEN